MLMNDQHIKEILVEQDETFKDLSRKHQQFDQKLEELRARDIKTDIELMEERDLKKQKLRIKDSMENYIYEFRKRKAAKS